MFEHAFVGYGVAVVILACVGCLANVAGIQTENRNVRGFVRKWRTRHDSNV